MRSVIKRKSKCKFCEEATVLSQEGKKVIAHYHKAGASNLIGETFSTQETGVIEIWEV